MSRRAGVLRLGLPLWAHAGFVGSLYPPDTPPGRQLAAYAARLPAVEANTTFYRVPTVEDVARWRMATPESFRFCFKLPRAITHDAPLERAEPELRELLARIEPLGPRLGPVLVQLPPGLAPAAEAELVALLDAWPADAPRPAVEVRHRAWFEPDAERRLTELLVVRGASRAVLDARPVHHCDDDPLVESSHPKPLRPIPPSFPPGALLVRFVAHPDPVQNDGWVAAWAPRLAARLHAGGDVWFFVHCPRIDMQPALLRRVHAELVAQGVPVDALRRWDGEPDEQLSLF